MTPNTATGETPFKLSHGCEVVLPVEFEVRVKQFVEGDLILKKVDAAGRSAAVGKLHPN
ncbi:hypothetical protein KSP39_PZI021452 [Platanthera zijinensis]|uniref:Uncharacterized protein n=1 Tax=Platanthera zijinensis TaxID=2320716 RepID=A0AAP0FW62_9ASPA